MLLQEQSRVHIPQMRTISSDVYGFLAIFFDFPRVGDR